MTFAERKADMCEAYSEHDIKAHAGMWKDNQELLSCPSRDVAAARSRLLDYVCDMLDRTVVIIHDTPYAVVASILAKVIKMRNNILDSRGTNE